MRVITKPQAEDAFDILVRLAGVRDDDGDRYGFVHHVTDTVHPAREYRLNGSLGWGGKFRNNGNRNDTPHVDCYREHETPERLATIEQTNRALAALFARVAA